MPRKITFLTIETESNNSIFNDINLNQIVGSSCHINVCAAVVCCEQVGGVESAQLGVSRNI